MVTRRKKTAVIRPFEEVAPFMPGEGLPGTGIGGPVDETVPHPRATKDELHSLLQGARGVLKRTQDRVREQRDELLSLRAQVRDEITARSDLQKALKEKVRLLDQYETTIRTLSALLAAAPKVQEFRLKMDWGVSGSPQSFESQIESHDEEKPL